MNKRYQVFISSTFRDLEEERKAVIQALMEMDCIPAGMEMFPATDEEQFEFIKRVIDDCDYYLLIIGGRYGSLASDDVSYTEKEFDYAVEKGVKVVALIHGDPDSLPFEKSEAKPEIREKLAAFREKVSTNRLVKYWEETKELPGLVSLSLSKTIKMFPAIGWVRANKVSNEALLSEINDIRKENEKLKASIDNQLLSSNNLADIAKFDEELNFEILPSTNPEQKTYKYSISWKDLFIIISSFFWEPKRDLVAKKKISDLLILDIIEKNPKINTDLIINEQILDDIAIQFNAYGLISIKPEKINRYNQVLFWTLTPKGREVMLKYRTYKTVT